MHCPRKVKSNGARGNSTSHAPDHQIGGLVPTEMPQHHLPRKDQKARIYHVLPGEVWHRPMCRFEQPYAIRKIGAWHNADSAHLRRKGVGNVVTIKVKRGDDTAFLELQKNLLQKRISDYILTPRYGVPSSGF
jgi:hypothetical protein